MLYQSLTYKQELVGINYMKIVKRINLEGDANVE